MGITGLWLFCEEPVAWTKKVMSYDRLWALSDMGYDKLWIP